MGNESRARYGRVNGRQRQELLARVLEVKGRICHLCNTHGADTIDHVIPLSLGGHSLAWDNVMPAHRSCNRQRGAKTLQEWFASNPLPTRDGLPPSREW